MIIDILRKLSKLGLIPLSESEIDMVEEAKFAQDVKTSARRLLSTPIYATIRSPFGNIHDTEWMLTNGATRRAALHLSRYLNSH
jgi:hypothetical protein